MITEEIKQSLTQYFEAISGHVLLVLQSGSHPKREELSSFLESLCALSPNLEMVERDTEGMLRSPISFAIEVDGEYTGIIFSGIPTYLDGNSIELNSPFPTTMRIAPSALEQTGTASNYKARRSTTSTCTSVPSFSHATLDQLQCRFNVGCKMSKYWRNK